MEQLLNTLGIKNITFEIYKTLPFMHPGRTARINPEGMGFFGELHPQVCKNYDIGTRAYVAVLYMDAVNKWASDYKPVYEPLPKFPSLQRDLALLVKKEITAAEIEAAINERGGVLLKEVKLFDVYQGPNIAEGFKSMAYNLRFRAPDRTLADEDIQKPIRIILHNLQKKCGAELRS
jgi:phenylalanyl-tRNA synthetase beta chain